MLKAVGDSVVLKLSIQKTLVELDDKSRSDAYVSADKIVTSIGPDVKIDIKLGDNLLMYPGAGIQEIEGDDVFLIIHPCDIYAVKTTELIISPVIKGISE